MATNDANQPVQGRQLALQVVHTLRAEIDYTMNGGLVGILPAGAIVLDGVVFVHTGFNDTTADDIDVGVVGGDDDLFASAIDANAQAYTVFDDLAADNRYSADERTVTWAYTTAATGDGTAGSASIVVRYSVANG
jgi:hypothetical protein